MDYRLVYGITGIAVCAATSVIIFHFGVRPADATREGAGKARPDQVMTTTPATDEEDSAAIAVCQTLPAGMSGAPTKYTPAVPESERLQDFHDLSPAEQLDLATGLMRNHDLSAQDTEFIKSELCNRSLDNVIRNNLANALIGQNNPDPDLHHVFLPMIDDPTESPVWRDYSLQFLSSTLAFTSQPELVIEKLKEVANHGRGNIQGTALVHLFLHERKGRIQLEDKFAQVVSQSLEAEDVSEATKLSLLAIIAERNDRQHLAQVRKYARQNESAALKRVAIAALGRIGDRTDLFLIEEGLQHKNRSVQKAAKSAKQKLAAQESIDLTTKLSKERTTRSSD